MSISPSPFARMGGAVVAGLLVSGVALSGAVLVPATASAALDTDGDGLGDDYEIANGLDWQRPDSDHDDLLDGEEVNTYKTSPLKQDTDGDGVSDGREVKVDHTDPLSFPPATLSMRDHIAIHPVPGPVTGGGYPAHQTIDVDGVVTMSQAAAQDSINHGYHVLLRYWGDDTNSDDLLLGPVYPKTLFAAADGLHFQDSVTFAHDVLDEDSGPLENVGDGGLDEIYVGARLLDPGGKQVSLVESNRVTGDF